MIKYSIKRQRWVSVSQVLLMFFKSVPDLIADFLLILLPVTSTATAEEDDGNNDEDQEYSDYGSCDDACGVGGWMKQRRTGLEVLVNAMWVAMT